MGTKRCDGTIDESAKDIPPNTPLRQRMELLIKSGDQAKKRQ
jgi:hypothetical protein